MLFNSLPFLYAFLPATYVVFWLLKTKNQRYLWLTVTGYAFYAGWNYKFCALMAFSTLVAYLAGLGLLRWQDPKRRQLCLLLPVMLDLSLLGFFKYSNFALDTTNAIGGWLGWSFNLGKLDIVLPVGISFYTFHTVTYIVDAYRGAITPTRNFFEFSCYVSLFGQLVAGPIVRFRQIEADLENVGRTDRAKYLDIGWSFFVLGLAKKVLLADTVALIIDPALANYGDLSTITAWLCMLGYAYQLYFDFSGYSDMAVGLGYLFGLHLPQNFNSPYRATDIADFWRRWHMSLSFFLRDYLFIPLGGSRGREVTVHRNLLITMLLGGLWHGANWTFVVWGLYHAILLILHRLTGKYLSALPNVFKATTTFLLVVIGWVFFRSTDFTMATALLKLMFSLEGGKPMAGEAVLFAGVMIAAAFAHLGPNTFELRHRWSPAGVGALVMLFVLSLYIVYAARSSPFLYFQF